MSDYDAYIETGRVEHPLYQLILVDNHLPDKREYPSVRMHSLEAISAYIEMLEREFLVWEENGFPDPPHIPILAHYEGCDMYVAKHGTDDVFNLNADGTWEQVP